MTITTIRPGDLILLNAAIAASTLPPAVHTTKMFARNLRHNSQFLNAAGGTGPVHRVLGTPVRDMIGDLPVVMVTVAGPDGEPVVWGFGLNESVYGVVGAI